MWSLANEEREDPGAELLHSQPPDGVVSVEVLCLGSECPGGVVLLSGLLLTDERRQVFLCPA